MAAAQSGVVHPRRARVLRRPPGPARDPLAPGLTAVGSRIVIVSSPPASGKTWLASRLAADCSLPLIAKDGIKEALFESVGVGDREWSEGLGRASFAVFWHVLGAELAAGRSALIEGSFAAAHATAELERLRAAHEFTALQVHCRRARQRPPRALPDPDRGAPPRACRRRADGRAGAPSRPRLLPAAAPDELVVVETASFEAVRYEAVLATARAHLTA